jgi:surface antigen
MARTSALTRTAAAVVTAGLVLTACTGRFGEYGAKESMGTLLGGAGGAVAGAQFGKGTGKLAAVAAGTLLGAFIGNSMGRSLDRADRLAMTRAQSSALAAPVGRTVTWNNPDSGHYGTVRTVREGSASDGAYCREYQQTVTVGGQTQQAYGTACRQPDGSWKVVND